MIYSNIDFGVVYVDPGAASGGDGTTPASALNALTTLNNNTCYIIRRTPEASCVQLPATADVSDTLVNICFMGMPKSSDRFWNIVPEAARTAWGADTADYANIRVDFGSMYSGDNHLVMADVRTLLLYRCFISRLGSSTSGFLFDITNTRKNTSVLVESCKFGYPGEPLEDDDFTSALTGNSVNFLHVKSARVFTMRRSIAHCYTSSDGPMGSGGGYVVHLENADYIALEDIDAYSPLYWFGESGPVFRMIASGATANYDSLRFHLLPNGTNHNIPAVFLAENHSHCRMNCISVDTLSRAVGSGTPTQRTLGTNLIKCTGIREFNVRNVSVSLPQCWNVGYGGHALYFSGYTNSANTVGGEHIFSNIDVELAETDGLDTEKNGNFYSYVKESSNLDRYAAVALNLSGNSMGMGDAAEVVTAENITVTHPRGVAFYASGVQLRNSSFKGTVKLSGVQADIASVESYYPGYALFAANGTTVRVHSLAVDKTTAGTTGGADDPAVGKFEQSLVYVDEANAALMANSGKSDDSGNQYAVICGNEINEGHFTHRTINCICDTADIARTGGAPASFKLWNNACDTASDMSLGHTPFLGVQLKPETSGKHVFVAYAAVKNHTDNSELATRLLIQVSVPQSSGGMHTYFSGIDGVWENDTQSLWNNESGLSCYKLTIPLELDCTGDVDVKIHYNWYGSTGFALIDPKFELRSV